MTLSEAVLELINRPLESLVLRWNWKAAFMSALIRAWIFFFANLTAGWRAAVGAMIGEYAYRAITSGFYGALTQNLSRVRPPWQAAMAAMILLPLSSHSLEFAVHWLRGNAAFEGEHYCIGLLYVDIDVVSLVCNATRGDDRGR
jgi:hypothetical protein